LNFEAKLPEIGTRLGGAHRSKRHTELFPSSRSRAGEQGLPTIASIPSRAIGLKDTGYADRVEWLHGWLPNADLLPYEETNTRLLSQAERSFFMLVLHGNDLRRMSRILRDWRVIFPRKPIVAIMTDSSAPARAELFRSGADFVFDMATSEQVAEATLNSAVKRWSGKNGLGGGDLISGFTLAHRLSRTETILAETLCGNPGRFVSYSELLSRINKPATPGAIKCLHVQIQRLRSKIVRGLVIENKAGEGYRGCLG